MLSYRTSMLRTLNPELKGNAILVNAALGLCGESGEFADLVKKHLYQDHQIDRDKAIKELGDIRYYLELAAYYFGISMEEVEMRNVDKLKARYPNGFEAQRSTGRKE